MFVMQCIYLESILYELYCSEFMAWKKNAHAVVTQSVAISQFMDRLNLFSKLQY